MTIKNGDLPASPQPLASGPDGEVLSAISHLVDDEHYTGLTKRERFAAMAMQGLLAGGYCMESPSQRLGDVSYEAASLADALLAELEK